MSDNYGVSKADKAKEFGPGNPKITYGGFPPLKDSLPPKSALMRSFPPPPNAAYSLNKRCQGEAPIYKSGIEKNSVDPKGRNGNCVDTIATRSIRDTAVSSGTGPAISTVEGMATDTNDNPTSPKPRRSSKGEMLADSINFSREPWVAATPGVSGLLWSAKDQREDFITEIDSGTPLEHCSKCQKTHIPPGPPLTLQDRDTCYSYLPEWFPAEGNKQMRKPWDTFTGLLNEIVTLQEISQGYNHKQNPDRKVWDLEFHEPHRKWKVVGRKSGWWKCRSGPDAPAVERNCNICRQMDASIEENARAARTKHKSAAARMDDIMEFMDKRIKTVAEKDKAIIEQRMRSEGWPQHLGIPDNKLPPHILRIYTHKHHASIQNLDAPPRDRLPWVFSSGYLADSECSAAVESANGLSSSKSFIL